MNDCLFCKIINKEVPAEIVYENEQVLVFKDIEPKAPVHLLLVPKKHLDSIASDGSEAVTSQLIKAAKELAKEKNILGYKLTFHVGREGGQVIDHLHLHLLAKNPKELT